MWSLLDTKWSYKTTSRVKRKAETKRHKIDRSLFFVRIAKSWVCLSVCLFVRKKETKIEIEKKWEYMRVCVCAWVRVCACLCVCACDLAQEKIKMMFVKLFPFSGQKFWLHQDFTSWFNFLFRAVVLNLRFVRIFQMVRMNMKIAFARIKPRTRKI